MAAVPESSVGDAAPPPWYPHALVDRTCEPSTFAEGLPSQWGRFYGWDIHVGLVMSAAVPLVYAILFAVLASVIIDELRCRGILNGDTAIAIIMTGSLAAGLVLLRLEKVCVVGICIGTDNPMGITPVVEAYLYGNLLLIDELSLNIITFVAVSATVALLLMYQGLLASAVDPIAARVQGIPVRAISLAFSIITAVVVVSMVKIIGALLVTAILVSPAATAQQIGKSFRTSMLWTPVSYTHLTLPTIVGV